MTNVNEVLDRASKLKTNEEAGIMALNRELIILVKDKLSLNYVDHF